MGLEASASGTLLLSGPGAVLPVGTTSGQGWAALSRERECPDSGDKVAVSDARRSRGGAPWPWLGTILPPVSLV